jgi:hypothetical protein
MIPCKNAMAFLSWIPKVFFGPRVNQIKNIISDCRQTHSGLHQSLAYSGALHLESTHWRPIVATTLSTRLFHSKADYFIEAGAVL